MPRNLRDFWVDLDVDGYAQTVARGPKQRGGGFSLDIRVASHGMSKRLLHITGAHLQNGKNRVIIELDRSLTAGEDVWRQLNDHSPTIVLDEERECHCLRSKDHERDCQT